MIEDRQPVCTLLQRGIQSEWTMNWGPLVSDRFLRVEVTQYGRPLVELRLPHKSVVHMMGRLQIALRRCWALCGEEFLEKMGKEFCQ